MERTDRVKVLAPEVAAKIAAGEVVDRPAALIRELVDNAIDAGASVVEVAVEGGGARRAEVVDDGRGMEKEDLELCWLPHATSKIERADDLLSVETLGFRGEALSSISAVARLEIVTSRDGREAWRLAVGPGGEGAAAPSVDRFRRGRGTTVRVEGLFDSFPARKKFLKRDAAEAQLCRQALLDKALAFPAVAFRYLQDGELKLFLPAVQTLRERFAAALLSDAEESFVHEIAAAGEGFSLSIVVGGPEIHRSDRRGQYVFANGRRIQDFGLQQALEYGVQGWFPNDSHPVGAVFVDIDPSLADFNIHPAKREARFKDPRAIHAAATAALRDFMHRRGIRDASREGEAADTPTLQGTFFTAAEREASYWGAAETPRTRPAPTEAYRPQHAGGAGTEASRMALEALLDRRTAFVPPPRVERAAPPYPARDAAGTESAAVPGESTQKPIRYLGTAFGLFLVVERGETLYLIDQHAAHERLLYDELRGREPIRQELLIPLPFRADSEEEDAFLEARREELGRLGIEIERDGGAGWQLTALPESWRGADGETVRDILDLRKAGADLAERFYATSACRAAAKDGDVLDELTAEALATAALALPVPRCPHGRPVWTELSLKDALKAVRRIE